MTRSVYLTGAMVVAILVLLPPVHEWTEELFSAHMLQHLVLIFVVAALLVGATPSSFGPRRSWIGAPLVVVMLNAVALWGWHLPALYDAALRSPALHVAEHLSFVATSWLFWGTVAARWRPLDPLKRAGVVFVTGLQSAALGALIAFASRPLYDAHLVHARTWGLTPLEDQQLAGGIMWVPPGVAYLVVVLVLLARWMNRAPHGDQRTSLGAGGQ